MTSRLLIIFIISICNLNSQTITGHVTDRTNADYIPFCHVTLIQNDKILTSTTTDIDGNFKINNVPPNNYKIISSYLNCISDTTLVTVTTNLTPNLTISLSCEKMTVCTEFNDKNEIDLTDSTLSVTQFVNQLKLYKPKKNYLYALNIRGQIRDNWISEKDLEYLMTLVNSKEISKCVRTAYSSKLPSSDLSTIGGQVMNILDAYRFKQKYPFFQTDCAKTDKKRVKEIRTWWKKRNKIN